jgi:predicted small secreted protein
MKTNHYLIFSTLVLLALAVAGCSDGEHAVAGAGKLASIDVQRGTNRLNA